MAITNAALTYLANIVSGIGTPFNTANTYIGVGDSTTAFGIEQVDLQGTNKSRVIMDPTYPQVSGATVTYRATFGTDVGNFPWQEWGIFNAPTGGVMLNRTVENNGAKLSNQTWIFTVAVTFATA
jgi:hypothetical protein